MGKSLLANTLPATTGVSTATSYQQLILRTEKLREGGSKCLTSYDQAKVYLFRVTRALILCKIGVLPMAINQKAKLSIIEMSYPNIVKEYRNLHEDG